MKLERASGLKVLGLWTSNGAEGMRFFLKVESLETSLQVEAKVFASVSKIIADGEPNPVLGLYLEDE